MRILKTFLTTLLLATGAAQAQPAAAPATLVVVHGIPGRDVAAALDPRLPVDVQVNGSICLAQGLTFGTISGPYTVPAGTYQVAVSLANTVAPCSNTPVINANVKVAAGKEYAVVAALDPTGAPTAYPFALDFSTVGQGQGRVIVAHAADAPAVNVDGVQQPSHGGAGAKFRISNLNPGQIQSADFLPPGTYQVKVSPVGSKTPVVGPVALPVPNDGLDLIFAVGNASSGSITVLTAAIPNVF